MKLKYILILVIGFTLPTLQSCNYTDLSPETFVDESVAFKDVNAVGKVVTGTYGLLSLRSSMGISEYIADDLVQGSDAGGAGTSLFSWTYADDGESSSVWYKQYSIINNANRIIIKGGELVPTTKTDEGLLESYLGQAYFLRAYAHFELLRFFAYFDEEDELGIPYVTYPHVLGQPGRDIVEDCYDYIVNDLMLADEMIDNSSDKTYATQAAVKALLARVSLYRKDYSRAIICAKEVLNVVPMETASEYESIWTDKSRSGVIMVLPRHKGDAPIGSLFIGSDNSSIFKPSQSAMNAFPQDDVRKKIFISKGPDRGGAIVDRVSKYLGTSATVGLNDEKIFRSAEMKLIIAEAYANQGKLNEANQELNELRQLRIKNWSNINYNNQDMLLEEILKERRRELIYENHRFFDLRRYKKPIKRDDGKTLAADHFRMVMPIPKSELQANDKIKDQQNIGY